MDEIISEVRIPRGGVLKHVSICCSSTSPGSIEVDWDFEAKSETQKVLNIWLVILVVFILAVFGIGAL